MNRIFTAGESRLLALLWHLKQTGWILIEIDALLAIMTPFHTSRGASPDSARQDVETAVVGLTAANLIQRNGRKVHLVNPSGIRTASVQARGPEFAEIERAAAEIYPPRGKL